MGYSLCVVRVRHDWMTKHTAQLHDMWGRALPSSPVSPLWLITVQHRTLLLFKHAKDSPPSCCEHLSTKYIFAHGCILVESVLRTGSAGDTQLT